MTELATELGTIADVSGTTVVVRLHASTVSGMSFIHGQVYRVGQIGGFVRIPLGYVDLYGIVSSVGARAVPERIASEGVDGRWMVVQLVGDGSLRDGFQRGVSQHPTVGDVVHLVTEADLRILYGRPADPAYAKIGNLSGAEMIPALVDVNKLISRHSVVVGTTGSGKSTTVAGLLSILSDPEAYTSSRIFVVDVHGEYSRALFDRGAILRADPDVGQRPLNIPYWALSFDELCNTIFGGVDDAKQRAMLVDKIIQAKRTAVAGRAGFPEPDQITVDTPVPFSIHQLWLDLHIEVYATHALRSGDMQSDANIAYLKDSSGVPIQKGDALRGIAPLFRPVKDVKEDPDKVRYRQSPYAPLGKVVDALGSKIRDSRMNFLLNPGEFKPDLQGRVAADLDVLLNEWLGHDKAVTVLDLSGVPPTIQSDLVGGLLRLIYDALFWGRNLPEGGRERPVLFVLEEAHSYLQGQSASMAIKRIAKEGRKYGISMMLVSQRPSEIDATILSQCGTIFALRLTNSVDRSAVSSVSSDNLSELMSMLPVLRTGEVVVVGEAVNLPVRAMVTPPPIRRRPDSSDPLVAVPVTAEGPIGHAGWNQPRVVPGRYDLVLKAWRTQQIRPS